MNFTFSHPVLGCLGLFGVHFIAISGNPLLATSFVYPLLLGAENLLYIIFALAANLQHFGTKNIVLGSNSLLAAIFVVSMLIVSEKNSAFYIFANFTWRHGTIWCALHCHK